MTSYKLIIGAEQYKFTKAILITHLASSYKEDILANCLILLAVSRGAAEIARDYACMAEKINKINKLN